MFCSAVTCTQAVALPQLSYRLGVIQWAIFLFHAALYGCVCLLVLKKHAPLGNMLLFSHTSSEHLSQRHKGATIVFYNASSSQALILYFTVGGREKKTEREREKKLTSCIRTCHVSVSHKQLLVSLCNLPVPQP